MLLLDAGTPHKALIYHFTVLRHILPSQDVCDFFGALIGVASIHADFFRCLDKQRAACA